MKKPLFAFLLFSTLTLAQAETLLVSDIDDTIKVSHVLDIDSVIANTIQVNNAFMGMPELYQGIKASKKADKFIYLSNAPTFMMKKLHQKFLQKSGFPEGDVILSKNLQIKNHKITTLRQIIREEDPTELILIGDNGEKDTLIYNQIQSEYPDLKMTTYIHQAYSQIPHDGNTGKVLEAGQTGFATSIDLASQFVKSGYLTSELYEDHVTKFVPLALAEANNVERGKPMMFPSWFDCRDLASPELAVTEKSQELVVKFQQRLSDRCTHEPYGN